MTPEPSEEEEGTTKFLILEYREITDHNPDVGTDPDAAHEALIAWVPIGEQKARDRDSALRLFLGEPVREVEGIYSAVSEAAWKPREVKIAPKISIREVSQ